MRAAFPWDPQEDQILTDMAGAGAMLPDIALVLKDRSEDAIKARAIRLKVSLAGKKPEIDMDAFKKFMKAKN